MVLSISSRLPAPELQSLEEKARKAGLWPGCTRLLKNGETWLCRILPVGRRILYFHFGLLWSVSRTFIARHPNVSRFLTPEWTAQCTHLLLEQYAITPKLLCCIIDGAWLGRFVQTPSERRFLSDDFEVAGVHVLPVRTAETCQWWQWVACCTFFFQVACASGFPNLRLCAAPLPVDFAPKAAVGGKNKLQHACLAPFLEVSDGFRYGSISQKKQHGITWIQPWHPGDFRPWRCIHVRVGCIHQDAPASPRALARHLGDLQRKGRVRDLVDGFVRCGLTSADSDARSSCLIGASRTEEGCSKGHATGGSIILNDWCWVKMDKMVWSSDVFDVFWILLMYIYITYLPHEAVAEVSKDKEPIGRECAEFNWFESQLMSDSNEVRVKWFWLSVDLKFNWFGCQLIWDSIDLVVNRFEIQMSRLSIDLRFEWFGCQMIWGSSDLVVSRWVIQMILSNEAFLRDFLQTWSFEAQKRSISATLPSRMKHWNSKTKHFCETSFKIQALKLKNEAFLRDFLQNSSFEAQKRSFSARLPSKLKLWSSKTKLFCETSFKIEALTLKNEAFLRDFLQNWHVEQTLDLRIPIRLSDFPVNASKVLRLPRKSWAEAYEVL